jgi:glycosyltransferase involved in cell wall biosynthesis
MTKPKLLWHSNAPHAGTGYAQQTALFAESIAGDYDLGISAFYGVEGSPIRYRDVPVYPALANTHGNETIREHAKIHFGGELRDGMVVTLMDVWVLDPAVWRELNVASWVPIDHEPLPPPIADYFRRSTAVPIAMSRFGEQQLKDAGLSPLYCPHAIDTSIYRPLDQAESRRDTQIPEHAFVVGMVAANKGRSPSRKCFYESLSAFKMLLDQVPSAMLYLHTELSGLFDGVNLPELIDFLRIPREAVLFCDQYRAVHYPFPAETMAKLYSSFDVLLSPSMGEGFGIPTVEAQAAGVPVIVSDFSAQPELCGAGWKVSGRRTYTALKAEQFIPDVTDIADALTQAYAMRGNKSLRSEARKFALAYDLDRVYDEFMRPALLDASERFADREPVTVSA